MDLKRFLRRGQHGLIGRFSQALTAINVCWVDRIFSPLVTLGVFLGQVLSADQSCRAAVARLIAHRLAKGQCPCSAETGASLAISLPSN